MNDKQKDLYNEWKRLEGAVTPSVGMNSPESYGSYGPAKEIRPEDVRRIDTVRNQVWDELKDILNQTDKFDLGKRLGKTAKEIFG